MIEALHISLAVPGRDLPILYETTLKINKGDFLVILGHNGSGKSSLIKLLSGSRKLASGSILLDGVPLSSIDEATKAREIVTLAQKVEDRLFMDLSLEENIALWESRFDSQERVSFEQIINLTNIPNKLLTKRKQLMMNFSGGEKQSILLGLALSHPPKVLFLDEHTASLDPKASHEIMEATNKAIIDNGITAVMVTHQLDDALKYGNRLIIMNEGRIVVDMPKPAGLSKQKLKDLMG